MLPRIKRIKTHVGIGRYLSECADTAFVIPRQTDIPSPYAYSPCWTVYQNPQQQFVVVVETAHRQYDVFVVPHALLRSREQED